MINSLQLINFKCFKNQKITLGNLTLLSGLNGMGKSTMMQAMLLLRQSYLLGLLQKGELALNGELARLGTAQDVLFEEATQDRIGIELEMENGKKADWHFQYNRETDVLAQSSSNVDRQIFTSALFNDNFHYLQAERIGPRTSFKMSDYMVRQHKQIGPQGEYTAHFLQLFGMNKIPCKDLSHPKSKGPTIQLEVEAWLSEVSPGTRIHVESFSNMDLVNLNYSVMMGKQVSKKYRSTNVGFGITFTLPVLTAILASEPGTIIFLENPEAHLHPKGQVRLGELMAIAAQCGIQIVVETHSDHILNGIRIAVYSEKMIPENISLNFFEKREYEAGSQIVIISPKIDRNGRIDYWPDGFFDEWDKSLEALLRKKGN